MSLGEALTVARKARGWSQEDLAEAAKVSQGALSRYETGARIPEDDVLPRLAAALGVTERFLHSAGKYRGAMAVDAHMRRRATAKPTVWRQLEARLNMYRMHTYLLFQHVSLRSESRIPTFDPIDTPPATVARLVRMQWRMPIGPVQNLIQWLEAAGCIIIEEDFGTPRVDGLSQWIDDYPVILINLRAPTDRKRLTLAHETGHLCLHANEVTEELEQEANAFAAEFLLPQEVIRPQLRNLTLGKLHDLKREWGVSMQALIERAWDLEVITREQRMNFYKKLSYYGWRTQEPVSDELPPERTALPQSIGDSLVSKGRTSREIAELAGFADETAEHPFRSAVASAPSGLRLVR